MIECRGIKIEPFSSHSSLSVASLCNPWGSVFVEISALSVPSQILLLSKFSLYWRNFPSLFPICRMALSLLMQNYRKSYSKSESENLNLKSKLTVFVDTLQSLQFSQVIPLLQSPSLISSLPSPCDFPTTICHKLCHLFK